MRREQAAELVKRRVLLQLAPGRAIANICKPQLERRVCEKPPRLVDTALTETTLYFRRHRSAGKYTCRVGRIAGRYVAGGSAIPRRPERLRAARIGFSMHIGVNGTIAKNFLAIARRCSTVQPAARELFTPACLPASASMTRRPTTDRPAALRNLASSSTPHLYRDSLQTAPHAADAGPRFGHRAAPDRHAEPGGHGTRGSPFRRRLTGVAASSAVRRTTPERRLPHSTPTPGPPRGARASCYAPLGFSSATSRPKFGLA